MTLKEQKKHELILSEGEITELSDVCSILELFKHATLYFSSEQVNLSKVLQTFLNLVGNKEKIRKNY